jgi:hypothetical protein
LEEEVESIIEQEEEVKVNPVVKREDEEHHPTEMNMVATSLRSFLVFFF